MYGNEDGSIPATFSIIFLVSLWHLLQVLWVYSSVANTTFNRSGGNLDLISLSLPREVRARRVWRMFYEDIWHAWNDKLLVYPSYDTHNRRTVITNAREKLLWFGRLEDLTVNVMFTFCVISLPGTNKLPRSPEQVMWPTTSQTNNLGKIHHWGQTLHLRCASYFHYILPTVRCHFILIFPAQSANQPLPYCSCPLFWRL